MLGRSGYFGLTLMFLCFVNSSISCLLSFRGTILAFLILYIASRFFFHIALLSSLCVQFFQHPMCYQICSPYSFFISETGLSKGRVCAVDSVCSSFTMLLPSVETDFICTVFFPVVVLIVVLSALSV